MYFNPLPPQYPFLPCSPRQLAPQTVPRIHSCPIIITVITIILGVGFTNGQEPELFGLSSLAYLAQHNDLLSSIHFPVNDIMSFFFMAE
jgi:hypothetical protein